MERMRAASCERGGMEASTSRAAPRFTPRQRGAARGRRRRAAEDKDREGGGLPRIRARAPARAAGPRSSAACASAAAGAGRRTPRRPLHCAAAPNGGPLDSLVAAVEPLAGNVSELRRQASDQLHSIDVRRVSLLLLLFFSLAFNNAIVDSVKDTLIVTSPGGAEQLPFLTVYAVLPASAAFLYVYNRVSRALSRPALFYLTLGSFMAFFGLFGFLLFPNVAALHAAPGGALDRALWFVPAGLTSAVGMLRNWTYTLFYTFAELWGDVVLGLLFWGLANECTKVHEAGVVYPIICCGANLAYACAGALMRALGDVGLLWDQQLRCLMFVFLTVAAGSCAAYGRVQRMSPQDPAAPAAAPSGKERPPATLMSIFERREITLLAVMSVAQGIAFSIFQVSWKSQVCTLCPTPAAYQATIANVQLYSGLTTLVFIAVAPLVFRFLGWTGAAVSTPIVMATGGTAFLLASPLCVSHPSLSLPVALLGSSVYVFMKAAKYSLFKPSEEMVYIDLDERSRTTGKAAVDVLGAQAGKAGGSCVQQALLLCFQTLSAATLPLVALHCGVIGLWIAAARRLAPAMVFRTRARARKQREAGGGRGGRRRGRRGGGGRGGGGPGGRGRGGRGGVSNVCANICANASRPK